MRRPTVTLALIGLAAALSAGCDEDEARGAGDAPIVDARPDAARPDAGVVCPPDTFCLPAGATQAEVQAALTRGGARICLLGDLDLDDWLVVAASVHLVGCGPRPPVLRGAPDRGIFHLPGSADGTEVTLERLVLEGGEPGAPAEGATGILDERSGGRLTLTGVSIAAFGRAASVGPPAGGGDVEVRLDGGTVLVDNGRAPDGQPDDGARTGFGGLRMLSGRSLVVEGARIEGTTRGEALRIVNVREVTLRSSVFADNFAGVTISRSEAVPEVQVTVEDATFTGHTGERRGADGNVPLPALALRVTESHLERTTFAGNRASVISESGVLVLAGVDVDGALDAPTIGVVTGCTDVILEDTRLHGTTDVAFAGFGSVGGQACARPPRAQILGGEIAGARGIGVAGVGIDLLIVMNGCCGDVGYGVLGIDAAVAFGAGNRLAAVGSVLQIETTAEAPPALADRLGMVFLTDEADPPVDPGLRALRLGIPGIRPCDAACRVALEARFDAVLQGTSLAGGALPAVEATEASAADALAGARSIGQVDP